MIQNKFTPKLHANKIVLALLTIFVLNNTCAFYFNQSTTSIPVTQKDVQTNLSQKNTPPYWD